ncbi:MAG: AAA family ATPase, partial [bacterium]|nr:AAA family ATPase [bacterium]
LNVYLGLSQLYLIQAEKEFNKGFPDILTEPFSARYKEIKYAYMLELKYIKKGDKTKTVKTLVKQAEEQLKQYSLDQKLSKSLENFTLIKLVLVFSGTELVYLGKANP